MKLFKLLFVFLAAVLLGSTPGMAETVRVSGIVVDETNHRPAAGANVELMRARGGESTPVAKTRAGANGRFAFAPQQAGAEDILVVRSDWQGYVYVAPAFDGSGKLAEMDIKVNPAKVRLAVFESTKEIVPLSFTTHHLAIESKPGGLKCVERIVVNNPTRKTFLGLGKNNATVLLNLPKSAKNVKFDTDVTNGAIEKRPDGWAIVKPIPPNIYDQRVLLVINYDMDWPSSLPWQRRVDFSRKLQYPTNFFFVARESDDKKLEVTAPKLSADQEAPLPINGTMETRIVNAVGQPSMGGQAAQGAEAKPALMAGDDLKVQVAAPVNPLFWGFTGFIVLLCLAVPLALWQKKNPRHASDKIEEPAAAAGVYGGTLQKGQSPTFAKADVLNDGILNDDAARDLIERIAALDEEFQNGKVGQQEYSASRATWKNQLVQQLSQQQAP
jgi:hypothetical protein